MSYMILTLTANLEFTITCLAHCLRCTTAILVFVCFYLDSYSGGATDHLTSVVRCDWLPKVLWLINQRFCWEKSHEICSCHNTTVVAMMRIHPLTYSDILTNEFLPRSLSH